MPQITIRSRWDESRVLYTFDATDEQQASGLAMRDALEAAVQRGAYLSGADLSDANLRGAYLSGAYLSGADLSGANLSGAKWRDLTINRAPLQIAIPGEWSIYVLDMHMQIGCELHALSEWAAFDDARIVQMDGKHALRFWRQYKAALLAMAAADGRGVEVSAVVAA